MTISDIEIMEIKEDYVSFETAKLLKEKGFNEICYLGYNENGEYFPTGNRTNSQIIQPDFCFICCPTLQLALKWLREIYKIHIEALCPVVDVTGDPVKYNVVISNLNNNCISVETELDDVEYNTYELACESALLYCLKNLI